MEDKIALDFECPQFVDFAAELESSGKGDTFFDCKDHQTPEDYAVKNPKVKDYPDRNCTTNEEETRLLNKLEASLSIFENTPKVKIGSVKGKLLVEKFPKTLCSQAKPIFKPNTVNLPVTNLHRSKSVACFNKILGKNLCTKVKGFRRRSSSLNDLNPQKKQTYAMTPMCLKRTIVKAKGKVLSSEERELEEIAKLQKQLIRHLRYNEMTLKRLKLKPKPCVISKTTDAKTENAKGQKGFNSQIGKLNAVEKKPRRNIQTVNSGDLKKEVMKIDNIIKNQPDGSKMIDKEKKENNAGKSKYPSVSSVFAADIKERNRIQVIKTGPNKKLGFHSGLVFHDGLNKSTSGKSFTFDVKIRERVNSCKPDFQMDAQLPNSVAKCKIGGKENFPQNKAHSTVQKATVQNFKHDIVKQVVTNKKNFDKHVKNPIKGLPLSENLARNKC